MDRRSFFKGMLAAAFAASVPEIAKKLTPTIYDQVADFFECIINGKRPTAVTIINVGNGWYRYIADYTGVDDNVSMEIDFRKCNGGDGLHICGPEYEQKAQIQFPNHILSRNPIVSRHSFSMYFKLPLNAGV
jgi:hypothetical protein